MYVSLCLSTVFVFSKGIRLKLTCMVKTNAVLKLKLMYILYTKRNVHTACIVWHLFYHVHMPLLECSILLGSNTYSLSAMETGQTVLAW